MTAEQAVNEDLKIQLGVGATLSVGNDAYAYYVSEILPNGVIGMYKPQAHFDDKHPWYGGNQVVPEFDPSIKSEMFIKRRYGTWWVVEKCGRPIHRFTSKWERFRFGCAASYRDPSF